MRIGEPARRHGIADEDIWHAVRNAIRQRQEDEFRMLIGAARDGSLPDMKGPTNVTRHTDEAIERAAARFEQWATSLDPGDFEDITDLRTVAQAAEAVQAADARLREGVQTARLNGRSWNQIAVALGVSRQAARQRFADKIHA